MWLTIKRSPITFTLLALIAILGLLLRLYPGRDHFLWIYDQARDATVIRSILTDKNIVLRGPQTDYPGLTHGPLSYYLLAPFYFLSQGDPNLPGLFMIILNLSTLIPLGLLVQSLFKDKRITFLTLFLFAISYEQVEYARWIFNFPVSVPALTWSYYFLWKERTLLAGLFLGLAIQGELFLLYLIPFFVLFLYWRQRLNHQWYRLGAGLIMGVSPLLIAELKFKGLATQTFFTQFLGYHAKEPLLASKAFLAYLDHLAVTTKHVVGGLSYPMALWGLILLIAFMISLLTQPKVMSRYGSHAKVALLSVLGLFFSHSVLFTFRFPNEVFLNVGLAIPLLIMVALALVVLWDLKQRLMSVSVGCLIVFFALFQLVNNTAGQTPFELHHFIQTGALFSQKLEIVEMMYELAGREESFSLNVIGTPYGVRTVWATVIEQYVRREGAPIPVWAGYKANGYPGENYFPTQDQPLENHILIVEPNKGLLPEEIVTQALAVQDEATTIVEERELYGYTIQLRKPIEK